MAVFGVRLDKTTKALKFIKATKKRGKVNDLTKNPFNNLVMYKENGNQYDVFVKVKPIYPNPLKIVIFYSLFIGFLFGFSWWHLVALPFLFVSLAHTKYFFYWMMKKGLKKTGYDGNIKLVDNDELLELMVVSWENQR